MNNTTVLYEQLRGTTVLCLYTRIFDITKYNTVCNKNINKQMLKSSRRSTAFLIGMTMRNQKIIYKDDIKIVTKFPCLFGHPVLSLNLINEKDYL